MVEGEQSMENMAEWKAPPEGFEVFEPPEVPDGGFEYKSEDAENGEAWKHTISDDQGREIYHREDSPDSAWQKTMAYDDDGRLSFQRIQKTMSGKESDAVRQFEYGEGGEITIQGKIEVGADAGHEWQETMSEQDLGEGRVIKTITTKILEQGENGSGNKPSSGSEYTKTVYMENGKWMGEKVSGSDGTEATQFPEGITELPEWE